MLHKFQHNIKMLKYHVVNVIHTSESDNYWAVVAKLTAKQCAKQGRS